MAMNAAVVEGRLTGQLLLPLTNLDGKVEAIRSAVGKTPIIAAGNSSNDVPMLRTASRVAVMVNPSDAAYTVSVDEGWLVTLQEPTKARARL
jgi:phosphoserine phosphatase